MLNAGDSCWYLIEEMPTRPVHGIVKYTGTHSMVSIKVDGNDSWWPVDLCRVYEKFEDAYAIAEGLNGTADVPRYCHSLGWNYWAHSTTDEPFALLCGSRHIMRCEYPVASPTIRGVGWVDEALAGAFEDVLREDVDAARLSVSDKSDGLTGLVLLKLRGKTTWL